MVKIPVSFSLFGHFVREVNVGWVGFSIKYRKSQGLYEDFEFNFGIIQYKGWY